VHDITLAEVIAWLIIGALAGSLAGMLVKRRKAGFGRIMNLGVGLVGAFLGGLLFKLFGWHLELLSQVTINLEQVVAGFVGALVFLVVVWVVQRLWIRGKKTGDDHETIRK
jgi:uncharacterized membrane protein YeaQ/YmgE (transglycosylase-associated protein family)